MPRYFFNIISSNRVITDHTGKELAGLQPIGVPWASPIKRVSMFPTTKETGPFKSKTKRAAPGRCSCLSFKAASGVKSALRNR
jgi:hypothetical protein